MQIPFPGMDPYLEAPHLWPDVHNSLSAALRQIYASANYERRINYHEPPPAPELSSTDAAWLEQHLHECGLRP